MSTGPTHEVEYRIRLDDLDYMGIVGNASWLILLQRVRSDVLRKLGYPVEQMMADGFGAVVASARIKYLQPARYAETVIIRVTPIDPTESSITLNYEAINQNGKPLIDATLQLVFIDHAGKRMSIPQEIRARLFPEPR